MHKKILLPALVLFSSLALVAVPLSFSETPSRPNEQAPSGIDPYNITCKNAYQLMIKTFDGKPICVMEKSVARLSAIGFATAAGDKSYDIKFKVIRDLFEVDSNAPEKLQTALEIREFLESLQNKIHVNEMLSGNYITLDSHSGFRESGLADGLWEESLSLQPSIPQASPKAWEIGGDGPVEYSTTNIQVKNVDEPDFVKNDAFNIYVLGDDKLATVKAFPPSGAALLSKIGIGSEQSLDTMLLSGDRLILFSENPQHTSATDVFILDMDDKENPQIMRSFSITGAYVEARMIEDHVYLLTSSDLNPDDIMMPEITDSLGMSMDSDVFYFPHDMHHRYVFNTITAFDTVGDTINSESYIMGDAGGVYVSEKNMYITYINIYPEFILNPFGNDEFFDSVLENLSITEQFELLLLSSAYEDNIVDANRVQTKLLDLFLDLYERLDRTQQEKIISKLLEDQNVTNHRELHNPKTIIHKISLDGTSFTHESTGAVPGHPINQFAMDEFDNRFRIATTDKSWKLTNAVYNLDADLDIIGQLENIAPGENMHSARFMGDKLYLVTFKQIDPFFVIDLSENQPKILGELKIPGFSDYLHPYDENLIIGIGRDAAENQWGGAQELGVKISMFDVSDVNNPTQVDYVVIGDWKAHSASLHDHKSVLVDKKRAFMSIPIHDNGTLSFFVYGITENGKFVPAGEVKHGTEHASHDRARSLYIGDFLYTITPSLIKINALNNIGSEINKVVLENKHQIIRYE